MRSTTLTVFYSCFACGLDDVMCEAPVRQKYEDVFVWMEKLSYVLSDDHDARSPECHVSVLSNIKVPIDGANMIGGPVKEPLVN